MIIDAHSHWLPEEIISNAHFYNKAWGNIDSQLEAMRENGIDKTILSYPTSDAHLKLGSMSEVATIFNDNVGRILKRYPEYFIGAALLPVDDEKGLNNEMDRAIDELGFSAISLPTSYEGKYLDDPFFLPALKKAQDKRIPVFIHSQIVNPIGTERVRDPLLTPVIQYVFDITMCIGKMMMSGIFNQFPDVKFVFNFFGGAIPFLAYRFDATYSMLRNINFVKDLNAKPTEILRNIYVDTSGETNCANFISALELFGTTHIVWGSDWPAKKNLADSISTIQKLNITNSDKNAILGENLKGILNI